MKQNVHVESQVRYDADLRQWQEGQLFEDEYNKCLAHEISGTQ